MYIGIDLGTSSVKVVLMTAQGIIRDEETQEYPVSYPQANWAQQDPELWWKGTLKALIDLLDRQADVKEEVKAIGFSGQMHGMVALDEKGEVLTPAILWCDQRTAIECEIITSHFGSEKLSDLVGNMALTGFTAPKILWYKHHDRENFDRTKMYLLPKDYINFKLSGDYVSDYSDASGTLLLDVKNKCYSKDMLEFIGLSEDQLPKLYESFEVTGQLSQAIKNLLGLSQEVRIVAGAGDQAAGAIGTGTVSEGIISVTLGTSGVVFAAHDDYKVDEGNRLHAFCHASGHYHSMGVMLSAANCLKWWADQVLESEIDALLEAVNNDISDIVFLPYLMGERTPYPDPHARGVFIGMSMTTGRADMTKAVLEGIAFGLKDSLEILEDMGIPIEEIRLIGGGARSLKWRQLLADIFGRPIVGINTHHGSALGAAILAAVGEGAFETVEVATQAIIKTQDFLEPDAVRHEDYRMKHKKYQSLYMHLKDYFRL